jgi:hypothetical protein
MRINLIRLLTIPCLLIPICLHAQGVFQQSLPLNSELLVLVSENPLEPRSVGSYTVNTYAVKNPEQPYDRFIAGLVRPRDGFVESIKIVDLNSDGDKEFVVIIRSAGTGGYLSADAFDISRDGLIFLNKVTGLAADANPVSALTKTVNEPEP